MLVIDAEVRVHYDRRCNRVVCEAAEMLGLTLSPVDQSHLPGYNWRETKLLPYLESKLSVKQYTNKLLMVGK